MIERAAWTKTLLDVLVSKDWVELPGCRVRTWSSYMDNWRLKIEQHGRYPGYGWRVYRRDRMTGGWHSRFFAEESGLVAFLFGD